MLNLQGDVVGLIDASGAWVAEYTYNAWSEILTATGTMAEINPLRYRGYYYDTETGFYYLQSRYYDPVTHRFINADSLASTGQGFTGTNMFAYCNSNPANGCDPCGTCFHRWDFWNDCEECGGKTFEEKIAPVVAFVEDIVEDINNYDTDNQSEEVVLESNYFSCYKGVPVIRINGDRSGSFGLMFITRETNDRENPEDVIRHEYGHTKQLEQMGVVNYALCIGLPSWQEWGTGEYYSKPWEITADIYGGVESRSHAPNDIDKGFAYLRSSQAFGLLVWLFID